MLVLVLIYLVALLVLGLLAERVGRRDSEGYFLAGRSFGPILLFFTMAATNFSAFFFLGFADAAYTYGFGEYGVMALGTALMPIMFYLIGRKAWRLGKEKGYATAPELIGKEMKSRSLRILIMFVMVIFTLPYLAVQAVGAGYIISAISGTDAFVGAVMVSMVIGLYVSMGGMRASGWTDVLQGILMFSAMLIAGIFIAGALGGFSAAGESTYSSHPELFTRADSFFTPSIWLSFMVLWIFADPMFPQLFSRFYTAKDEKSMKMTMMLYPFLISVLFLIPVLIGVWARGLDVSAPQNRVMIVMVQNYTPGWMFYLVMLGALSALMSTADSQLFALSTMLVRDLNIGKRLGEVRTSIITTWVIVAGTIAYSAYFFENKADIMGFLVKNAFSGLAILAPVFLGTLYWKRIGRISAMASILIGESYVVLAGMKTVPNTGFLDGVVALAVAAASLILLSFIEAHPSMSLKNHRHL